MNLRVWMPVAIIGMLVGVGAAYIAEQQSINSSDSVESTGNQAISAQGASKEQRSEQRLKEIDRTLPEFSLASVDETVWTASTLQGKPWIINFWATWCPPCIEELPSMNAAYRMVKPQGIGMLAINAGEGSEAVELFLDKIAIDFPNVLGDENTLVNWSVRALPTTIVVNAEGKVVYEALGPREWDDEKLLQRVLDLL